MLFAINQVINCTGVSPKVVIADVCYVKAISVLAGADRQLAPPKAPDVTRGRRVGAHVT